MAILNQIISPLLPVALEVGQLHAVERLKVNFGKASGEMICYWCSVESLPLTGFHQLLVSRYPLQASVL